MSPARAALLPDRWCAVGFLANVRSFVAWGGEVRTPLHCAPDVADLVPYDDADDALGVDAGMAWMVDYEQALAAGMAITVDVSDVAIGEEGLSLLVAGVGGTGGDDAALLSLLEAHYYTDGLDVLAQGTPTNNTDEAAAGWTAEVVDVAGLFARELDGDGVADRMASGAAQLATALGLGDDTVLQRLPGAVADEDAAMTAMNRVIWPVSWGRYLDILLAPEDGASILPRDGYEAIRDFFIDYVRGGAPLPTLSVGPCPFGLLPIVRRDSADMHSSDPLRALEGVLLELRERWRESLPGVHGLDPVDIAPDEVAAEILGLLPHPKRFVIRRLDYQRDLRIGVWEFLWEAGAASGLSVLTSMKEGDATTRGVDDATSIEDELSLLDTFLKLVPATALSDDDKDRLEDILETAKTMCLAHQARQTPINDWYPEAVNGALSELVTTDPKMFWSSYSTADTDELFARPLVATDGDLPSDYLLDLRARLLGDQRPSAVGRAAIASSSGTPLLQQLLEAVIDGVDPSQTDAYAGALAMLAQRPTPELELRLRETLGLASHRLDAWITGLASQALASRRGGGGGALHVGGFGWVEKLIPDAAGTRESGGFIHAPSLQQAVTGAVLRSGFNAHRSHDPESAMAVDLRSERVRVAAQLLDGVRRGGALGDLLGCRFERRLHDRGLDRFIDDCRRRVLEAHGKTRAPRGPVDGLELAGLYDGDGVRIDEPDGTSFTVVTDAEQTDPARRALQDALDSLLGDMDAIADASVADAVHHVLEGNLDGATATLDAIATGAVPPPSLDSLATPVTGASVSHRLLVALAPAAEATPAWGVSPRSQLEPALSAWVAEQLGDPRRARCTVTVTDTGEQLQVTLADLAVSPLDAVLEPLAVWERRARAHVLSDPDYAGYESALDVDPLPPGELGFTAVADLAAALRTVISSSRPLDARDLALPGAVTDPGADLDDADARVAAFRAGLETATATLEAMLPPPTDTDPAPIGDADLSQLRAALRALAGYGIGSAVPVRGYTEAGRAALHADARSALAVCKARLAADSPLEPGFLLLPHFAAQAAGFERALGRSGDLLGGDRAAAMGWLRGVAHVRERTRALEQAISLGELLFDVTNVQPVVGQIGAGTDEPWLALEAPADRRRGALCWFVIDGGGRAALARDGVGAGVVVDEWAEVVPTGEVVTGVAVDLDAPSSQPPQTMLLGLPPRNRRWGFDAVLDTLLEAFEAAKLRAVDPDVLVAYGQQAPAIFVPATIDSGPEEEAPGG